jgi:hypothetical protein
MVLAVICGNKYRFIKKKGQRHMRNDMCIKSVSDDEIRLLRSYHGPKDTNPAEIEGAFSMDDNMIFQPLNRHVVKMAIFSHNAYTHHANGREFINPINCYGVLGDTTKREPPVYIYDLNQDALLEKMGALQLIPYNKLYQGARINPSDLT